MPRAAQNAALTLGPQHSAVSGGLEYQWVCQIDWAPEAGAHQWRSSASPKERRDEGDAGTLSRGAVSASAATGSSTQTLHRAPTDRLREDVHHDTGTLHVFGACDLARAIGQPSSTDAHHDTITMSGTGGARADPTRAVGRPTCTADREGDDHPRGRRAPTRADGVDEEDAAAVVVRPR